MLLKPARSALHMEIGVSETTSECEDCEVPLHGPECFRSY
jgi:hypothetical protein